MPNIIMADASGADRLKEVTVTIADDFSGSASDAFSLFKTAIGTENFTFCLMTLPDDYVLADSSNILGTGARVTSATSDTKVAPYIKTEQMYYRLFRKTGMQGPYAPSTNANVIAWSTYKVWGWDY